MVITNGTQYKCIQVGRLYMENTASSDPRGPQHGAL